jgi:hypothetical protein
VSILPAVPAAACCGVAGVHSRFPGGAVKGTACGGWAVRSPSSRPGSVPRRAWPSTGREDRRNAAMFSLARTVRGAD